eukprot:6020570-Prorocentrum_lima.AAC.1
MQNPALLCVCAGEGEEEYIWNKVPIDAEEKKREGVGGADAPEEAISASDSFPSHRIYDSSPSVHGG